MALKLSFDATKYAAGKFTPYDCALFLWTLNADEDMNFATACDLAPYDREVYDELWKQATGEDLTVMSQEAQAALCLALVRPKPRKRTGATARRDARLRTIASILVRDYGLPLVQNQAGGNIPCTAAILADLPGTPAEKTIANMLTKRAQK